MNPRIIELTEYQTVSFPKEDLPYAVIETLYHNYPEQVRVETPSFLTNHTWRLTSQGWAGYIPLTDDFHFQLKPKVEISNIFKMLEYAYRLRSFKILDGLIDSTPISDIFDRLALILAKRVLERISRGLYRSYQGEEDELPYLRGRLDLNAHLTNPTTVKLHCSFEDHTPDLEENQILLWTLTKVLECGICSDRSLPFVRRARLSLLGSVGHKPFSASSCVNRLYTRLNDDYEPMHALCRFFLENTGPTHQVGDKRMLPVLVNMERLFELFVVEWLKVHVPKRFFVRGQNHVQISLGQIITVNIDITIDDTASGQTCLVLDTKYKVPSLPSASDIEQVVAYAAAKECERAVLVYPTSNVHQISGHWGNNIYAESQAFDLNNDVEESGMEFLSRILPKDVFN